MQTPPEPLLPYPYSPKKAHWAPDRRQRRAGGNSYTVGKCLSVSVRTLCGLLQSGWKMIRLTAMVGLFKIGLYEPNEGQIKHRVHESYQPMQTWTDNAPVGVIFNFET